MEMVDAEKFWAKVDRRADDECWDYSGPFLPRGYGLHGFRGGRQLAHRVAFYLTHDHWPTPMCCHTCDRPPCCNPSHLYEGTAQDNADDVSSRGRRPTGPSLSERIRRQWTPELRREASAARRGAANANAKLSEADVETIRGLYATGKFSQSSIATRYGITQGHVSRIVNRTQRT